MHDSAVLTCNCDTVTHKQIQHKILSCTYLNISIYIKITPQL